MKQRRFVIVAFVSVLVLVAASLAVDAAGPLTRPDTKTVTLDCSPGWRAGAGGTYGGVGFNVNCKNGRANAKLRGVSGTAYSIRVGVEGDVAGDCFFSGDSDTADHTCIEVRVSIR